LPQAGGLQGAFYVPRFLNINFRAMVKEIGFAKAFDITRPLPSVYRDPARCRRRTRL